MQTVTLSVRVPKTEADQWMRMAHEAGMDRATLLKQALRTGCASTLFERGRAEPIAVARSP